MIDFDVVQKVKSNPFVWSSAVETFKSIRSLQFSTVVYPEQRRRSRTDIDFFCLNSIPHIYYFHLSGNQEGIF